MERKGDDEERMRVENDRKEGIWWKEKKMRKKRVGRKGNWEDRLGEGGRQGKEERRKR